MDSLNATARFHKVAAMIGIQDLSQLPKDYGRTRPKHYSICLATGQNYHLEKRKPNERRSFASQAIKRKVISFYKLPTPKKYISLYKFVLTRTRPHLPVQELECQGILKEQYLGLDGIIFWIEFLILSFHRSKAEFYMSLLCFHFLIPESSSETF